MPMYEFRCPECQTRFEEITSPSRLDDVVCENCGYEKPERQLSTFATRGETASSYSSAGCGSSGSGFS